MSRRLVLVTMLDWMLRADTSILLWVRESLRSSFMDMIMRAVSNPVYGVVPLAVLVVLLLSCGNARARILALAALLALLLTDQTASSLIKPIVHRTRPCFALPGLPALVAQAHSPSFPSSHAANNAAVATVALAFLGRRFAWLVLVPAVVGVSRVYLGVHYPGDVLAGWALGVATGLASAWFCEAVAARLGRSTRGQPVVLRCRVRT